MSQKEWNTRTLLFKIYAEHKIVAESIGNIESAHKWTAGKPCSAFKDAYKHSKLC